jgi:acetolactate synthase I/II/III large subunit
VLGVGTRLFHGFQQWGVDDRLAVIRVEADPEEPERFARPAVALIGDARPILRRLVEVLPSHNRQRASRREEMIERQSKLKQRLAKLAPQIGFLDAIRAELPEDGILVEEVTQMGFAARVLYPVYKPRTFISPGYQDSLGWGYATALGVQDARRDVPVLAIAGDGGFMFTVQELATARELGLSLPVLVYNNHGYGEIRDSMDHADIPRVGTEASYDVAAIARGFGCATASVTELAQLEDALTSALAAGGPTVIELTAYT